MQMHKETILVNMFKSFAEHFHKILLQKSTYWSWEDQWQGQYKKRGDEDDQVVSVKPYPA